ncbi:MAG: NERD domain-containing protein [Anaerolineales bacterium]|nr:NERD domain-containing protein [Anaerolineales bacterium]
MRIIDPQWIRLAEGYQDLQILQDRLEVEFGRALQVGQKRKHRREMTEWQRKRLIFFVTAVLAVLALIALCVSTFFFRDALCVLAWWTMTVLCILVATGVALRAYIREMVSGRPALRSVRVDTYGLAKKWWASLAPREASLVTTAAGQFADFLTLLNRLLPDSWLTVSGLPASGQGPGNLDLLLVGPSGIWLLAVKSWPGTIFKQHGVWKQVQAARGKMGKKQTKETVIEPPPDDEWLDLAREIVRTLQQALPPGILPSDLDPADLVQGGLVFAHPGVQVTKANIQGHTAAYGLPDPWLERLRTTKPLVGFSLPVRMQVLDALIARAVPAKKQGKSAKAEAERVYQETAAALRGEVERLVK